MLQLDDVDSFSFKKIKIDDFKYKDKILMANNRINNKYFLSQLQSNLTNTQNASFACLTKASIFQVKSPEILKSRSISIRVCYKKLIGTERKFSEKIITPLSMVW